MRTAANAEVEQRLTSIVGTGGLRHGGERDAVDGLCPARVVSPADAAEVAVVLALAADTGLAVVARGGGGHLDRGAPPRALDLVIDMGRLAAISEHEPGDMRVTVEAGCTLGTLEAALAPSGQWLPLDPAGGSKVSIGGLIAADLHGPLRPSQGRVRDLLLGLRLATPEGRLVSGGGKVVKNVAGYDLPKLHVGALGTLGIVVEATFRLRPCPRSERALVVHTSGAEDAGRLALDLRDCCEPAWLEITGPGLEPAPSCWALAIGSMGHPATTAAALAAWQQRVRSDSACDVHEDGGALRATVARAGAGAAACVLRASVLPTEIGALLATIDATANGQARLVASVTGTVRAAFDEPAAALRVVRALRPQVEGAGGALIVEHATAAAKHILHPDPGIWGSSIGGLALMQELRRTFDPRHTLAPGRSPGDS